MAEENIPWMIQGGKHSAASGRRVLHKATGGAEGVAGIGDLRVRAAAVANGTVIVSPGGATIISRYPNIKGESYDGNNNSDTTVNIAPNGSGATRYDLVIARIDDWNMPGAQAVPATLPTDTTKAFKITVITGVSATVKRASELNLGYPAIALARIALPAATSAVTQAMIFDLREKAVPLRQRDLRTKALAAGQQDSLNETVAAGEIFPDVGTWQVEVPAWAARARLKASWGGVLIPATSSRAGYVWVRVGLGLPGSFATQIVKFQAPGNAGASRQSMDMADDVAIPASMRGQIAAFSMMGRLTGGAGPWVYIDEYSSISLDIEFLEAPAEDA